MIVESVLCVVVLHFCMCWVCGRFPSIHDSRRPTYGGHADVNFASVRLPNSAAAARSEPRKIHTNINGEHSLYVLAVVSPVIIIIIIIDSEYIINYINIVTTTTFLSCPTAVITILIRRRRHHHHRG